MRLCAALAVVIVALVTLTVKVGRRAPRHAAAAAPEATEAVGPAASEAPPPSALALVEQHESSGIAYVHGRVLFPAGSEPPDDVEVVAESGTRTFDAKVLEDGRFQIHLPPGVYTLVASADDLVGSAANVLLHGGAEREVDIPLAVGAAIRGRLRAPVNAIGSNDIEVTATIAGREEDSGVWSVEGDTFAIEGLLPGRSYELRFQGPGLRTVTMSGVSAPADGLFVELQERATVRGAIGFARGTRCPVDKVALWIDGQQSDDGEADLGRDCTFELPVPDQAIEVVVAATGQGWFLEQRVAIPAKGDPGPICLNPPCRSNPEEDFARLRLTLDGASADSYIEANVRPTGKTSGSGEHHLCYGGEGSCDVEGLVAGETLSISATGEECRGDTLTVTVVAGDNHVRIPCHRQRKIEGVIRVPEDQQPDSVIVRCAGGDWKPLVRTRVFEISCESHVAALEYRIGSNGTVRSVPIASLAGSAPAFVDIGY